MIVGHRQKETSADVYALNKYMATLHNGLVKKTTTYEI